MSRSSDTIDLPATPLHGADPLCAMSAMQLEELYRRRDVSPVEVAQAVLNRAEEVRDRTGAFIHIDANGALAAARASEGRWKDGKPLSAIDGIPTTIKDVVWVKDWIIRFGSAALPPAPCTEDSPSVARLRSAGAVLVGLTSTPEFGWKAVTDSPLDGVTRNPWNTELTPGGSSGGAAAAAAAGAGVLHLGSDGGGSIRIPASFCGVTGHKPTFGHVAAYPASAYGTLAHIGPIARTVGDLGLMLAVMAGFDRRDWFQTPGGVGTNAPEIGRMDQLRIGYWSLPAEGITEPAVQAAIDRAAAALAGQGARISPVVLPEADLPSIFRLHWYSGIASRVLALPTDRQKLIDPALAEIVEQAKSYSAIDYVRAQSARASFGLEMEALFDRFDLIISPAVSVLPFAAGQEVPSGSGQTRWTEWAGFTYPINLSQQPACVIPAGRSADGRPIGLQLIGPRGADEHVLSAAAHFERVLGRAAD